MTIKSGAASNYDEMEQFCIFKKDEGFITYWFDRVGAAGDPPSDISVKDFRLLLAELENAADNMREHLSCL